MFFVQNRKPFYTAFVYILLFANALLLIGVAESKIADALAMKHHPLYTDSEAQVIIIDAGHGGVDGGAIGYKGSIEKELNLAIALKLRDCLLVKGYRVIMVRETDCSIHDDNAKSIRQKKKTDLQNRLAIANQDPDAIYISIHQNSGDHSSYHGAVVLYSPNHPDSKQLGGFIRSSIISGLQPDNKRELKRAKSDLFILYNAKSVAVLVECGFISNPDEERLLNTDFYQQQMADTITAGITAYVDAKQEGKEELPWQ